MDPFQPAPGDAAILASARCGMALVTPQGEWLAANPALCRMLGEPAGSLVGQAAHRRLFPDSAERIDQVLRGLHGDDTMRLGLDVDYRHPDGTLLRLEFDVQAMPRADGTGPLWLLQVHDATAAHRVDAAWQALAQYQEQLGYGLAHDLRASLRAIEGFAKHLEQQPLDASGRDQLERIHGAAAQAGDLVDALVRLSRATTVAHADEPVDLSLLATWVAAELQDMAPGRDAAVAVQPGLVARGDERQLRLMLQQLLHNAWKFSSARERIEIAVEGGVGANGTLELCVRDNGRGFDMRHADKLFLPFRRLHGPEDGGGHGLGLAIVHAIVQRHGGRAWARSQPGAGSRFFVELPLQRAGSEA